MRFRRSASSAESNKIEVPASRANFQLQLNKPLVASSKGPSLRACDNGNNCSPLWVPKLTLGPGSAPLVAGASATIIGIVATIILLLLRK